MPDAQRRLKAQAQFLRKVERLRERRERLLAQRHVLDVAVSQVESTLRDMELQYQGEKDRNGTR